MHLQYTLLYPADIEYKPSHYYRARAITAQACAWWYENGVALSHTLRIEGTLYSADELRHGKLYTEVRRLKNDLAVNLFYVPGLGGWAGTWDKDAAVVSDAVLEEEWPTARNQPAPTVAHELGHLFGLGHTDEADPQHRLSLMGGGLDLWPNTGLTDEEREIVARWVNEEGYIKTGN